MVLNCEEVRNWILLILAIAGFYVAYKGLVDNTNQRKTENSFRYVDLFYNTISKEDMELWKVVYRGSYDRGSETGFLSTNANIVEYVDLFTEGAFDKGTVDRMSEVFELIAEAIRDNKVDFRLIYFELGQFMIHNYNWLNVIQKSDKSFVDEKFGLYLKLMKDKDRYKNWRYKTIYYYE